MRFDPITKRALLRDSLVSIYMRVGTEEALQTSSLGTTGKSRLAAAIQCYLVGLYGEGTKLLAKAHGMLQASIERKEHERVDRPAIFADFAVAQWLLRNVDDTESFNCQVDFEERRFALQRTKPDKFDIQVSLASYLAAQRYERLINRYHNTGLKSPVHVRRIQSQGTMCFVLALHRLRQEYTDEETTAALQNFLKRSVKAWLGQGHYIAAALWMKIAHWQPGDDPIATLLRCYDYLPGLEPPKYPPARATPSATSGQ